MTKLIRKYFIAFVIVVIAMLLTITLLQSKSTIDSIISIVTMSLSASLSIAMFYKKGKLISIFNILIASTMAVIFWQNHNLALFLLMLYSITSSIYMSYIAIDGQRDITNLKFYIISVVLIFAFSVSIYIYSGKFSQGINLILTLEFLSFALTAMSQTLLVMQSRWLFLTFAIKDVMEAILGFASGKFILVAKNTFFFLTNIFSYLVWKEDHKKGN